MLKFVSLAMLLLTGLVSATNAGVLAQSADSVERTDAHALRRAQALEQLRRVLPGVGAGRIPPTLRQVLAKHARFQARLGRLFALAEAAGDNETQTLLLRVKEEERANYLRELRRYAPVRDEEVP